MSHSTLNQRPRTAERKVIVSRSQSHLNHDFPLAQRLDSTMQSMFSSLQSSETLTPLPDPLARAEKVNVTARHNGPNIDMSFIDRSGLISSCSFLFNILDSTDHADLMDLSIDSVRSYGCGRCERAGMHG